MTPQSYESCCQHLLSTMRSWEQWGTGFLGVQQGRGRMGCVQVPRLVQQSRGTSRPRVPPQKVRAEAGVSLSRRISRPILTPNHPSHAQQLSCLAFQPSILLAAPREPNTAGMSGRWRRPGWVVPFKSRSLLVFVNKAHSLSPLCRSSAPATCSEREQPWGLWAAELRTRDGFRRSVALPS